VEGNPGCRLISVPHLLSTRVDRGAGLPVAGRLTPPTVGRGELAMVVEAPPAGLPRSIRVARIQCGAATGGGTYVEARILGGRRPVEVAPTPVRIGGVVGRLASVQLSEDYGQAGQVGSSCSGRTPAPGSSWRRRTAGVVRRSAPGS
jgi:hypothetical protein